MNPLQNSHSTFIIIIIFYFNINIFFDDEYNQRKKGTRPCMNFVPGWISIPIDFVNISSDWMWQGSLISEQYSYPVSTY